MGRSTYKILMYFIYA